MAAEFEGVSLTADGIEVALRAAAAGQPPVRDVEAAQNPAYWAGALGRAAVHLGCDAALKSALERLLRSGSPAEIELATALQRDTRLLPSSELWSALGASIDTSARDAILLALLSQHGRGELSYDAASLRALASSPMADSTLERALVLLGKYDADWLVEHASILGASEAERVSRIGHALTALGAAEVEALATRLRHKIGPLPSELAIDAIVDSLRKSGQA